MTVGEAARTLTMETMQPAFEDRPLARVYTSDLLSDVMAHAHGCDIFVTIQSHRNAVAVASLVGAAAIVVCNERPVPEEMIAAAAEEEVAIFRTTQDQFTVSGRLYELLQQG